MWWARNSFWACCGRGAVAGLVRLFKVGGMPFDCHAHENTVLVRLPGDGLRTILDGTPLLRRDVALFALKQQPDSTMTMRSRALSTCRNCSPKRGSRSGWAIWSTARSHVMTCQVSMQ